MQCRIGCGACCIAPSISSPIPGMEDGKKAGQRCVQLDQENKCRLFGLPERPAVCRQFSAQSDICGASRDQALILLTDLEQCTG
ncbi:YkgJ family cysteine cluster protein [Idiomarina seosinensis]|uniref:YkgJ family cysteine cluster protein n=1 Tax=Idiomarina seosinensis TaxID=281739 RepID=UPI00384F4B00